MLLSVKETVAVEGSSCVQLATGECRREQKELGNSEKGEEGKEKGQERRLNR